MMWLNFQSRLFKYSRVQHLKYFERSYLIHRKYPVKPEDKADTSVPELDFPISKGKITQVYVWGMSEHGGLGILRQLKKRSPRRVPRFLQRPCRLSFAEHEKVSDIACGYGFTLFAIKTQTSIKVFGTGINSDSQLGYHAQRAEAPMGVILAPAPITLPIPPSCRVASVAAGRSHSLILVEEGNHSKLFTLGNNAYGQCGRKIVTEENYSGNRTIHCIKYLHDLPIRYITCGQDHSVMINTKGEVFACGWGADGQTGQGHYENVSSPSLVQGDVQGENIVKVASGGDCNLAINEKGDLFGWGNSEYSQMVQEQVTQLNVSRQIKVPDIGPVIDIAAGGSFCAVLNARGEVWVWGFGLLGLGPQVSHSLKPQQVPPALLGHNALAHPGHRITSINSGLFYLAAVSSHGDLYTWGRNKDACLGLGHRENQPFPLRVSIGAHVLKVSCGVDHMVALCKPFSKC